MKWIPVAHPENGNAPWAPPPGKLLVVADAYGPDPDSETNYRKCAMVDGDKVRHKPCVWEDKSFYWEQRPDGKVSSIVTGKCIGPDLMQIPEGRTQPYWVKMTDCSSPGAGIVMKKTGGRGDQQGWMKVVMEFPFAGESYTRCMAESSVSDTYNSGANKDTPKMTTNCDFKVTPNGAQYGTDGWFFG
jgi:hypothetical protein